MILDDDDKITERAEIGYYKFWLRTSHANLMNYLKTSLGQAEIKHKT